jgi:hypothetical protein
MMITTKAAGDSVTFRIEGALEGEWVDELERRLRRMRDSRPFIQLDLCRTASIDNSGKNLIAQMFADGVEVVVPTKHSTRVQ